MSLLQAIKRTVGMESTEAEAEWECQACGNVFSTHSEESHFATCRECGSGEVERVD
ncbi:MAG: hypothetical protein ABEJ61_03375 [Haloferacaceae archaeon]